MIGRQTDQCRDRNPAAFIALIGTWEIVDFSRRQTNGQVTTPFGSQAAGRITYDADGNVVALLMHATRRVLESTHENEVELGSRDDAGDPRFRRFAGERLHSWAASPAPRARA
jgi:hypothetical protein